MTLPVLGALLLMQVAGGADETDPLERRRAEIEAEIRKGLSADFGVGTYKIEEGLAYASRGVQVASEGEGLRLRADSLLAWLDDGGGGKFSEFYAEGSVILEIGDGAGGYDVLRAEQIYFNARLLRGRASGVQLHVRNLRKWTSEGGTPEWGRGVNRRTPGNLGGVSEVFIAADELEILGVFRYRARQARVTTCDYGAPHYALHADEVEVKEAKAIHLRGVTVRAGGVPFLYWPRLYWSLDWNPYIPSISFGRSSEFGTFVESEWTLYAGDNVRLSGIVDNYSKRGTGLGGNLRYRARQMRGKATGYTIEDRGEDELFIPGFAETPPPETQPRHRWRGRWFHWNRLPFDWDIFAEYSQESDRNFLAEYFESEARESKERETMLYLRKTRELWGTSIFFNVKTNDFQTQVESLPRIDFDVIQAPLFDVPWIGRPVYYLQETELGNLRHNPDDLQTSDGVDLNRDGLFNDDLTGDGLPDPPIPPRQGYDLDGDGIPEFFAPIRSWRFDTHHELRMPVPLGPVTATPFAGGRYTWYEKTLVSDDPSTG